MDDPHYCTANNFQRGNSYTGFFITYLTLDAECERS